MMNAKITIRQINKDGFGIFLVEGANEDVRKALSDEISKTYVCTDRGDEKIHCNECKSCKSVDINMNPDVVEISVENLNKDLINDIFYVDTDKTIMKKPYYNGCKVLQVYNANTVEFDKAKELIDQLSKISESMGIKLIFSAPCESNELNEILNALVKQGEFVEDKR